MGKRTKVVFSLVFATLIFSIISIANQLTVSTKTVYADEIVNSEYEKFVENECVYSGDSYISFETEKVHYLENEEITVSYVSHYENGIADISYSQDGFNVISLSIDQEDNKVFTVNVSYTPDRVDYSLQIQVEHIGGELAFVELHGYLNEYGMFISQFSPDSAREKFYTFAKAQNLMTEEDCQQARHEFWIKDNQNSNIAVENVQASTQGESVASTTSDTIKIAGGLTWEDDDGGSHPLRYVKLELYKSSLSRENLLATTYANNIGNYAFEINKSSFLASLGSVVVYVVVYAGDNNVMVQIEDGEPYSCWSNTRVYLTSERVYDCDFEFDMSNNLGQAMQISQALLTASNYAQVLMSEEPEPVTATYPDGDSCAYTSTGIIITKRLGSTVNSYAAWDVIMHEYGHHVQEQINNSNIPSLNHIIDENQSDNHNNKDDGTRLAWGEAWATVFGMMAQKYYSSELNNIATTRDEMYESYSSSTVHNLETANALLGDGCELSIMGVLWDLYDSEFDTNDLISLGHTAFWNLTAVDGFETFSDFVNNLYEEYPEYTYALGQNLTYYKMATTAPVMTNSSSVSQTVPPTFTWTPQGGSVLYPNNSFQIVIFDANHEEIFRTASTTSTSYTLTQNEWQSTLFSFGQSYCAAVVATQTAAPITGGYISEFSFFVKPSASALSETFTISASNRYTEKVVNLQPSQYIDYNVTLQSGTKLIQTFGTCDVVMEIYDANGTLLEELDDQGCGLNSLATLNVVSDNVQYKIRLFLYNPEKFGTVKLVIIPANSLTVSGYTSINEYSQIYRINTDSTNYVYATSCEQGYMSVLRYAPTSSGYYQVTLSSDFDNYLYIIDPRSTEFLVFDKDYRDDWDEEDTNAYLNVYLEQGVDYLIVFGPTYLTADLDDGYIMLRFRKFD